MSRGSWSRVVLVAPSADVRGPVARAVRSARTIAADPGPPPVELRVWRAHRLGERIVGLIGKPLPAPGAGLWLQPCMAVHTCGVRGAIDLLFVDRRGAIVRIFERVRPLRVRGHWRARAVLEMTAGEVRRLGIREGMCLRWREEGGDEDTGRSGQAGCQAGATRTVRTREGAR